MFYLVVKAVPDCDLNAIRTIVEHLEGKPAQSLNLGQRDGQIPMLTRRELS